MNQESFDILLLGLRSANAAARTRFATTMERLTGRSREQVAPLLETPGARLFHGLGAEQAEAMWTALDDAGVLVEVRPVYDVDADGRDDLGSTITCPRCSFVQPVSAAECSRCGLVFAKHEREKVQTMQREKRLEEAVERALVIREEWNKRAKVVLEHRAFPEGAAKPFAGDVKLDEIPFCRLDADEGPLLLTSRRLLADHQGRRYSVPFELIKDVDFGGGLVAKKDRVRMVLSFHCPLATAKGPATSLSWNLSRESSQARDVVMDWAFARSFICGACGQRDLDFRLQDTTPHARCMHCATDHEIDLEEAIAVPQIAE